MNKIISLAQGQSPVQWFSFLMEDGQTLSLSLEDVKRMYNHMVEASATPLVESAAGHLAMIHDILFADHNARITRLEQEMQQLMNLVTVDKDQVDAVQAAVGTLTAAVTTFSTDQATALADIAAKISALQGSADPTTATELGNILAAIQTAQGNLQTLDANIKAADPGPITPVSPAPAPTPATSSMDAGGASHTVVESTPGGNKVTPRTTE